jgi:hypothetical protein
MEKDSTQQELKQLRQQIESLEKIVQTKTMLGLLWCDSDDVCKTFHISPRTLRNYRKSGLIPFSKMGGRVYYRISDIYEYLENHMNIKTKKS